MKTSGLSIDWCLITRHIATYSSVSGGGSLMPGPGVTSGTAGTTDAGDSTANLSWVNGSDAEMPWEKGSSNETSLAVPN